MELHEGGAQESCRGPAWKGHPTRGAGHSSVTLVFLLLLSAKVAQVRHTSRAAYGKELEKRNLDFYLSLAWRAPEMSF